MDFNLTEEQKLLQKNARDYMDKEIIPFVDEYERKYKPLPMDVALDFMRTLEPLGYTGGMISEEWGGGGLDYVTYAILIEELGRAWGSLPIMMFVHEVCALAIDYSGTEEQKKKYLPDMVAGNRIGSLCLTEPNAGSSNREMETTIVPNGDHYIVNGTKTWITNGGVTDISILVGFTDKKLGTEGVSTIIADGMDSPFEARELPKLGLRSCPTAELSFTDFKVVKSNLLGQEGQGYKSVHSLLNMPRVMIGAMAVGLAQAAMEYAIQYALDRQQFGKPIGKMQAVQQMVADMAIETEAIRLLTHKACALQQSGIRCAKECSGVKFFASETAVRVCSKAMEILGGYGISEEYPLERYFRDARTLLPPDGTSQIQRLIVGREVLGVTAFV
jgi:alkylation response protein AidB-like acyl-CoA dehydrogenase